MSPSAPDALSLFAPCLKNVPDPRSKQSTSHPYHGILALVLFGLLAITTPAEIERGTKHPFHKHKKFLCFGKIKGTVKAPCDNTLSRVLKKLSLGDQTNLRKLTSFSSYFSYNTTSVAMDDIRNTTSLPHFAR